MTLIDGARPCAPPAIVQSVNISYANVDSNTGDFLEGGSFGVTVDVAGQLTDACRDRYVGEVEIDGGWSVGERPLVSKVEPASLLYMCVDGDAVYAPTETWTGSDGLACSCTEEYMISCQ